MFFCKHPYLFFFPQLWKRFSTVVVNVYHSCEKPFPQLWKEKKIRSFAKKAYDVSKNFLGEFLNEV